MGDPHVARARALHAHPELAALMWLREDGWRFMPLPEEIVGYRTWPEGWMDAIRVRDSTNVLGWRVVPDEPPAAVWRQEGGLVEVVEALLGLPAPGEPGAPRLVLGAAPTLSSTLSGLWLPPGVGGGR